MHTSLPRLAHFLFISITYTRNNNNKQAKWSHCIVCVAHLISRKKLICIVYHGWRDRERRWRQGDCWTAAAVVIKPYQGHITTTLHARAATIFRLCRRRCSCVCFPEFRFLIGSAAAAAIIKFKRAWHYSVVCVWGWQQASKRCPHARDRQLPKMPQPSSRSADRLCRMPPLP